jgi:formate hydrogenlyase subunit 4
MIAIAVHAAVLLSVPPLLLGVIGKTKAWFAGRVGPPLLQPYYDVWKLLGKGAVYSRTATWVFRAGPMISLAALLSAGLLLPLGFGPAPLGFGGDMILFAYLLGLGRFVTMAAALDTGSSFEGMGASREAAFSALAEPALLLALAIVAVPAQSLSFLDVFQALPWESWGAAHPEIMISVVVIFCVLLAENSRVPVDDPATHLELTMIHEVMVLDHGGPDLAFILYRSAVKLFLFAGILVNLIVPLSPGGLPGVAGLCAGSLAVAVLVGVVESTMARLRRVRVPQLLVGASVIAAAGLVVLLFRGHS